MHPKNISRFLSDIGGFHHHECLDGFIVLGRNLEEIGIRIACDTWKATAALSFATQDASRFHGHENQLLGGFIVKQDEYQIVVPGCGPLLATTFCKNGDGRGDKSISIARKPIQVPILWASYSIWSDTLGIIFNSVRAWSSIIMIDKGHDRTTATTIDDAPLL